MHVLVIISSEDMVRGVMGIHPMGGPVRGVNQLVKMQNGLTIPSLGLGTYRMKPEEVAQAVKLAVENGFRHIDCAKVYMNEKDVGFALADTLKSLRIPREDIFVTSKLWPTDQHPDNVEKACRETLADLRLDYLDLYLIHWPIAWKHTGSFATDSDRHPRNGEGFAIVDKSVTLSDTWLAMTKLVDKGLVKSIGLSNCNGGHVAQIMAVVEKGEHAPVVNQVEYHPGCHQTDLWSMNTQHGLLTAAYCPLGMPTRFTAPDFVGVANDELLKPLTTNTGYSVARVLLNWNLDCGNVVIVKSTKKEHIMDNAKACRFALSDSVRWVLNHYEDQLQKHCRVINPVDFFDEARPFFETRAPARREHHP